MKQKGHIKSNSFKTPENYFSNFSKDLQVRISEEKLKDKFGNENSFSVPKDYFKNFSVNLKANKKRNVFQLLKPYISIAAGIIIVFGIWQIILSNFDNNAFVKNNDSITIEKNNNFEDVEFADNIDYYIDELDLASIQDINFGDEEDVNIDANDDEISEYLIDYADDTDFDEILASL